MSTDRNSLEEPEPFWGRPSNDQFLCYVRERTLMGCARRGHRQAACEQELFHRKGWFELHDILKTGESEVEPDEISVSVGKNS